MRYILIPLFFFLSFIAKSQDGVVDVTFGSGGLATNTPPSGNVFKEFQKTVVLPNGKILQCYTVFNSVTNNYDFGLTRYLSDGTIDISFDGDAGNADGFVTTDFGADEAATALTVQSDGKIIVVGYKAASGFSTGTKVFAIARYNADGTLDTGFDGDSGTGNGKFTTTIGTDDAAYGVAENGTLIYVAGYAWTGLHFDIAIAGYNSSNGTLNTSFNTTGKKTTSINGFIDQAYAIKIQTDSKVVVAGYTYDGVSY